MTLAQAFAAADHDVTVASGGAPVDGLETMGIRFVQLPPLKSDGTNFTTLLTASGDPADPDYLKERQRILLDCLNTHPDLLITELYPFGRRVLAGEFNNLLDRACQQDTPPIILCSIRDILAPPSKPAKAARTDEIIARYFDGVLVHSDERATPLEVSWPVSNQLRPKLQYTGFVAPSMPVAHPDQAGLNEILVSAGGGAVGAPMFRAAVDAAALSPDLAWRILIGGREPEPLIAQLKSRATENVHIEAARPDFRQMLNHAIGSVSLAGYNTAMDVLQTGIPAVFIPFDDGGEVEQSLRAQSLSELPAIKVLRSADLTPARLQRAVRDIIQSGRRAPHSVAMTGAQRTVEIAEQMVKTR